VQIGIRNSKFPENSAGVNGIVEFQRFLSAQPAQRGWESAAAAAPHNATTQRALIDQYETGLLIRKLMGERGMFVPPVGRTVASVCIVELCK
jgi:hypothetical protein